MKALEVLLGIVEDIENLLGRFKKQGKYFYVIENDGMKALTTGSSGN